MSFFFFLFTNFLTSLSCCSSRQIELSRKMTVWILEVGSEPVPKAGLYQWIMPQVAHIAASESSQWLAKGGERQLAAGS